MAYCPKPPALARHATNLLKGKLLKSEPVWLPAVRAVPPGPSIIRSQSPQENITGETELEKKLHTSSSTATESTRHKQKHLRTKPPRPRAIVYPEDRLRRQFYKDHPFELARPKTLVENDLARNRTDFSQLLLPGMRPSDVDGEAVIKYQLHLMTHENLTERQAYAKATSEFYDIRAKEEEMEREARAKMTDVLQAINNKKWTQKALRLEERALKQSMASTSL